MSFEPMTATKAVLESGVTAMPRGKRPRGSEGVVTLPVVASMMVRS